MDIFERDNYLEHYGMPRRSGRYPWGSGEDPYQHTGDFASRVQDLRRSGMNEKDVATAVGCKNTSELRSKYAQAISAQRADRVAMAKSLKGDGHSNAEVARRMGIRESTLRSLLNEKSAQRTTAAQRTAALLKSYVDEKGMIDVGTGVERELGISREKLTQALDILREEGYRTFGGGVPQTTNKGKQTNMKVLCPPDTPYKTIVDRNGVEREVSAAIYDFEKVHTIRDYRQRVDPDGTEHFDKKFEYPSSMDSSRLMIRFRDDKAPDGHTGVEKDGTVEIRRGVPDLDLQGSHYAQVRIMVDNDKYIKGMAFYSDDIPDGIDVVFNTNKTPDQAAKVLKPIKKDDPDNPFGALLREEGGQYHYTDANGERKLGLINKTRHEGDWGEWADTLPSQFLSKQSKKLIDQQLSLARRDKELEFEEICGLNNPTVKKELLKSFADDCDAAAVHLKAAALPRQKYQVILPIATLPDNEVYAPNYNDGEKVALIRFPHGGIFEIPILTVNNKHPDGRRVLGNTPEDAIGINFKVAERLSGADFDGDTVMVIPCNSSGNKTHILSKPALKGLEDFDAKVKYGTEEVIGADGKEHYYRNGKEIKVMTRTGFEMGMVSNLITDMTIIGATDDELARAVRHSMVVIDAEKHKLDWKASEEDNGIAALQKKYQMKIGEDGKVHYGGASTLISMASSRKEVLKRRGQPKIDPDTGEYIYNEVRETYVDKDGKTRYRTQESTKMAETKDARTLSSGTIQEEAYANYANSLKALANRARKEMVHTGKIEYNSAAKETYREEVSHLKSQLNIALLNAPRERQAQLASNSELKAIYKKNPDLTNKEKKKLAQQSLSRARQRFGAQRHTIDISPREWEAIQSGAISETQLKQILRFADGAKVREYATPRTKQQLSPAKQARITALRASGLTTAQIANAIGVSTSTVSSYLNK